MRRPLAFVSIGLFALAAAASCQFDRADRWLTHDVLPPAPLCAVGDQRCGDGVQECQRVDGKLAWATLDDCKGQGLVCVPDLLACKTCIPNKGSCKGQVTQMCDASGDVLTPGVTCDPSTGSACRSGACVNLCVRAGEQRSNVGCEYWAVDLDNANVSASLNAASQQFAVVISNPQPDVTAKVSIERDDSLPGEPGAPFEVATATIPPLSLQGFQARPARGGRLPRGRVRHRHPHRRVSPRLPRPQRLPGGRLSVQPARERERVLERRLAAQAGGGTDAGSRRADALLRGARLAPNHRQHRRPENQLQPEQSDGSARVPHHRRHSPEHHRAREEQHGDHRRRPGAAHRRGRRGGAGLGPLRRPEPGNRRLQRGLHRFAGQRGSAGGGVQRQRGKRRAVLLRALAARAAARTISKSSSTRCAPPASASSPRCPPTALEQSPPRARPLASSISRSTSG